MSRTKLKQHILHTLSAMLLAVPSVYGATLSSSLSQIHDATKQVNSANTLHDLLDIGATPGDPIAQVYDANIGEWSARWWQWVLKIPASDNPLVDTTGANCSQGQKGPVWFLAGVFAPPQPVLPVERSCTIPRGKSIFFPIYNFVWVQTISDNPKNTESDYRQCVSGLPLREDLGCKDNAVENIGGLAATLNKMGANPIPIAFNFRSPIVRAQSPVFKVKKWPDDSVFYGLTTAQYNNGDIVSDGFWVMLPPLKAGSYVLKFRSDFKNGHVAQDITYNLNIVK